MVVDKIEDIDSLSHLIFELDDIEVDAQPEDGFCHVDYLGDFTRKYKIVSMEEIEKLNSMSKTELEKILRTQPDQDARYMH